MAVSTPELDALLVALEGESRETVAANAYRLGQVETVRRAVKICRSLGAHDVAKQLIKELNAENA